MPRRTPSTHRYKQLRSELKIALDALAQCDEELVAARKGIVRLKDQRNKFKASSATQAAELAEMDAEIQANEERILQLEAQVNELTTTQTALSKKLKSAERRTEELTVQTQDQKVKLETQQVVLRDTADGARKAQLEAEKLGAQLVEAKSKVDDLERVRDGISVALANSQSRVSRLEQDLDVMKTSMEQLEVDMAQNNEAKTAHFRPAVKC